MVKIEYSAEQIPSIPMDPNENSAKATTIGDYFVKILLRVWEEGESFSGKRPFGDSGWEYEPMEALAIAEGAEVDEWGYTIMPYEEWEELKKDLYRRIHEAIPYMCFAK